MRTQKSTFTLIELIVVISILSILSTMLLTVLDNVRGEVKRIQCTDNMRQQYYGFSSYASDNNNYYPASKVSTWQHQICRQLGIDSGRFNIWESEPGAYSPMVCPDALPPGIGPKWRAGVSYNNEWWGGSYSMTVKFWNPTDYAARLPTTTQFGGSSMNLLGYEAKRVIRVTDNSVILVEAPYVYLNWDAAVARNGLLPFELDESLYNTVSNYGSAWRHGERSNFLMKEGYVVSAELGTTANADWVLQ